LGTLSKVYLPLFRISLTSKRSDKKGQEIQMEY
jgi:hypothetical protein